MKKKYSVLHWQLFIILSLISTFFSNPALAETKEEAFSFIKKIGLPGGTGSDIGNDVIPFFIKLILSFFSIFLTVVIIWAGVLFVAHFGDEEKVSQAKKLLVWALVGVAITAISYAFVSSIVGIEWE